MPVRRLQYANAEAAADACAAAILSQLATASAGGHTATLAVSGGSSPVPMFRRMAAADFDWSRVHLFWVDERAVPPTDARSNYRLAEQNFIAPAAFPRGNVHRVLAELEPAQAASHYVDEIREFFGLTSGDVPRFDVIHRGIGPDAHTASLFPGEPLIADREGIASAVWVEKLASWRITLLPAVLLAADSTVILATAAEKSQAVRNVFEEPYDPIRYPCQLGLREVHGVEWYLDAAAAELTRA